jgi:hypothetical protein
MPSKRKINDTPKPKLPPGELPTCKLCGQQPESIAFDPDECRDECPFRRTDVSRGDLPQASAQTA